MNIQVGDVSNEALGGSPLEAEFGSGREACKGSQSHVVENIDGKMVTGQYGAILKASRSLT